MQSRKLIRYAFMATTLLGLAMTESHLDAQRAAAPQAPIERAQARSMVITQDGIVAAESPLAAQAGVEMLKRGGNAVDAAIAANAVMGVVAPMSNGIGGDLFVIYYDAKSGKLYGLNASGSAPAALNAQLLRDKYRLVEMPLRGIHSVTVPGAVDGWQKLLDRFGDRLRGTRGERARRRHLHRTSALSERNPPLRCRGRHDAGGDRARVGPAHHRVHQGASPALKIPC